MMNIFYFQNQIKLYFLGVYIYYRGTNAVIAQAGRQVYFAISDSESERKLNRTRKNSLFLVSCRVKIKMQS